MAERVIPPEQVERLGEELHARVRAGMAANDVPGMAVGLCDADEDLWLAAYGATARGGSAPVTPASMFSVQSTSKLYTATLVLAAVADQLVDLDEPIVAYLPDFHVNSVHDEQPQASMTLRHLLSHTAGLTHEAPTGSNFDVGTGSFDDHCRSIFGTWLRFPVGHHHEYSNLGIDLAGYVLQRVADVEFAELARRRLFAPLGLDRSTFDGDEIESDHNRAIGHWHPFDEAGLPLPVAVPMVAAGGLYTSLQDALRFVRLHLRDGEQLIPRELLLEQRRIQFALPGQEVGYGLGVYVDDWAPGVRVFHHGGSGFGFHSQLCWLPDFSLGIVVLSNAFGHAVHDDVARFLVESVAEASLHRRRLHSNARRRTGADAGVAARSTDRAAALTGEYIGRLDDRRVVVIRDGRLLMEGADTWPAALVDPDTIELEVPSRERYRLSTGRDGRVSYLHSIRDGRVWYRNEPPVAGRTTIDQSRTGTYAARSWGLPTIWYRIAYHDDGTLAIERVRPPGEAVGPPVALRLSALAPDLYVSSVGEILDFRDGYARYANVELARDEPPAR